MVEMNRKAYLATTLTRNPGMNAIDAYDVADG